MLLNGIEMHFLIYCERYKSLGRASYNEDIPLDCIFEGQKVRVIDEVNVVFTMGDNK